MTHLTILTDARVITIVGFIITTLLGIVGAIGLLLMKKWIAQQEEGQKAFTAFCKVIADKLGIVETQRAVHSEKLEKLTDDQAEQKKKLDQHSETLSRHGEKFRFIEAKLK